jgi:hypothetical protein
MGKEPSERSQKPSILQVVPNEYCAHINGVTECGPRIPQDCLMNIARISTASPNAAHEYLRTVS